MERYPLISVVVPVFNVEKYLHKCLDSIINQTYHNLIIILVDDGSTDQSGIICDLYATKDCRIKVIHQKNGGVSAARNAGLEVIRKQEDCQFFTFIDSDDIVCENYVEVLYKILQKEQADISEVSFIKSHLEVSLNNNTNELKEVLTFSGREACICLYNMEGTIHISPWGKLFRKALFLGLHFPTGKIHEDQAIIPIVLYRARKVVFVDAPLYFYRVNAESIMQSEFSPKRYDDIEALENCRAYFEDKNENRIVELIDIRIVTMVSLYSLYARKVKIYKNIPKQYKLTEYRALKNLERHMTYDYFTWYLSKVHPNWIRPYSYWRKIKEILSMQKR